MSVEIYRFFHSFMILYFDTSFKLLEIAQLAIKNSPSDVLRSISDNVMDIRQHKATNYIYPRSKKIPLFIPYMVFYVLYWTSTFPQDHCLFHWTRCVVSLSFLFSDTLYLENINSWRIYYGNIFLLVRYVFQACELFSAILIVFAIDNFQK